MLQHEQSLADRFGDYVRDRSSRRGYRMHSFSLDGQDRDAGADYVLTNASRFALVEFKFKLSDVVSEKHKARRLSLCQGLTTRHDMRELHDSCHFVAWAEQPVMSVKMNIYRKEICNRKVFGPECGLQDLAGDAVARLSPITYVDQFLDAAGNRSLSVEQFNEYVEWLMVETSGSSRSTFELIASDPTTDDLVLVRLSTITAAHTWLQQNYPSASPRPGPFP